MLTQAFSACVFRIKVRFRNTYLDRSNKLIKYKENATQCRKRMRKRDVALRMRLLYCVLIRRTYIFSYLSQYFQNPTQWGKGMCQQAVGFDNDQIEVIRGPCLNDLDICSHDYSRTKKPRMRRKSTALLFSFNRKVELWTPVLRIIQIMFVDFSFFFSSQCFVHFGPDS